MRFEINHGTIFGPIIINYFDEIRKKVFPLPFLGNSIQPTKFNPLKDSIEITNPFVRGTIIFEHTASSEPMITWLKKKGNTETFLHTNWSCEYTFFEIIYFNRQSG